MSNWDKLFKITKRVVRISIFIALGICVYFTFR